MIAFKREGSVCPSRPFILHWTPGKERIPGARGTFLVGHHISPELS